MPVTYSMSWRNSLPLSRSLSCLRAGGIFRLSGTWNFPFSFTFVKVTPSFCTSSYVGKESAHWWAKSSRRKLSILNQGTGLAFWNSLRSASLSMGLIRSRLMGLPVSDYTADGLNAKTDNAGRGQTRYLNIGRTGGVDWFGRCKCGSGW